MRSLRTKLLLLASVIAVLMAVGVSSASAATDIEGVWAFNGGEIGIGTPLTDGTYVGTVVQATTFAECPHPVGQQIWTGIRAPGRRLLLGPSPVVLRKVRLP